MAALLHLTDGESVAGTLRESAVPGDVAICGDLLYEGPAPAGRTPEQWRTLRAGYHAEAGYRTFEQALRYLEASDQALANSANYEETVLWFDRSLSNQLMRMRVLDWLHSQDFTGRRLTQIPAAGAPPFGGLTADQLAERFETRIPVTPQQFKMARSAWEAFTAPHPVTIMNVARLDTPKLPWLPAFRRHLEEFPAAGSGLSRTERQALAALHEQGPLSATRLFFAAQQREEVPFMGDVSFFNLLKGLAAARQPLIRAAPDGRLTLLEAGLDVLEGRADHAAANGIDRWLGGVHLSGNRPEWRWDAAAARIVRC
jgi:hypothetical protein